MFAAAKIRFLSLVVLLVSLASPALSFDGFDWQSVFLKESRKARALRMINSSYSPKITFRKLSERSNEGCTVGRYQINGLDPVDKKDRAVHVLSYVGKKQMRKEQAVVIVPSIVGVSPLETWYADLFCGKWLRALIIENIERDEPVGLSLKDYDRAALRKLAAIRHSVEFLYADGSRQVGVMGTSQGAIAASLALGIERKIKAGALIAGGGNLPEIIVDSTQDLLKALREERMKAFGFRSRDEYLRALRANIVINNLDFAGHTGFKPVFVSIAEDDTKVPTPTQWALARAFRAQHIVRYRGNHIPVILKTYLVSGGAIYEFFRSNL